MNLDIAEIHRSITLRQKMNGMAPSSEGSEKK
jgi:hypothetical protein